MQRRAFLALAGAAVAGSAQHLVPALASRRRQRQLSSASIVDLGGGPPGMVGFQPAALNDAGLVVGSATSEGGQVLPVIWQAGTARPLPFSLAPEYAWGQATAINATGAIIGGMFQAAAGRTAVIWSGPDAEAHPLDVASRGFSDAVATDVNDAGVVCGFAGHGGPPFSAVVWANDQLTVLALPAGMSGQESVALALDPSGTIAGSVGDVPNERAVVWRAGQPTVLEPDVRSLAEGIMSDHLIVGSRLRQDGSDEGPTAAFAEIVLWMTVGAGRWRSSKARARIWRVRTPLVRSSTRWSGTPTRTAIASCSGTTASRRISMPCCRPKQSGTLRHDYARGSVDLLRAAS